MSDESKKVPEPEEGKKFMPEFRAEFVEPGTLRMEMDLHRMSPAWAIGCCVVAQDMVRSWYAEVQAQKQKILRPNGGAFQSMRNFVMGKK